MDFLSCHIGEHEPDELVSLTEIWIGGKQMHFGCIPCLQKHGLGCERHRCAKQGFRPDGAACLNCITEEQKKYRSCARDFLEQVYEALPLEIAEEMNDLFDTGNEEDGQPDLDWRAERLLREAATRALCRGTSVEDAILRICREKSIRSIFP